jgi:hypothetical protein
MRRRIAVVGDTLSSGGRILDYEQVSGFRFHGHKAALLGNEAYCERCGSTGTLAKAGGPHRLHYHTTREAALDEDIVLCQCPTPPHVTASLAGESWCDDRAEEFTHMALSGAGGTEVDSPPYRYDEQYTLTDSNGCPLAGVRYRVRVDSTIILSGATDANGRTQRIPTDEIKRLYLEVATS